MKFIVKKDSIPVYEATLIDDDVINGSEVYIGRDPECHVVLDSPQVSRHHVIVYYADNKLQIKTESSYGSVKLNGYQLSNSTLENDSKIEINEFEVLFSDFSIPTIEAGLQDDEFLVQAIEEEELIDPIEEKVDDTLIKDVEEDLLLGESIPEDDLPITDLDSTDMFTSDSPEESNAIETTSIMEVDNSGPLSDSEDSNDSFLNDSIEDEVEDNSGFEENQDSIENGENFEGGDTDFGSDEAGFGEDSDFSSDGGFDDNAGFGGGDSFEDDDSKTQVIKSFASYKLKIFGEYAPFDSYEIEDQVTKIGRDKNECQIILDDAEVSKVHAIIKKTLANCILEDNESSNGIIYNGERINRAELSNGDEFIIGETTFSVQIKSDLLESEEGRLMPIEDNQEVIIEEDAPSELSFDDAEAGSDSLNFAAEEIVEEKSLIKKIMKDPKKRMIAIVVVGALFLLFGIDDEESTPKVTEKKTKEKVIEKKSENKLSPEKLEIAEQNYQLALAKFQDSQYYEAKEYINIVKKIDANYKNTSSLDKSIQESLDAIIRNKEEEERQKEKAKKLKRVAELVEKAKEAVEKREVEAARSLFSMIYELDPENIDVPSLKIVIDSYVEEQERIKEEKRLKEAKRRAMIEKLEPGKKHFLKGEYYEASIKLARFIKEKDIDEDLMKEGVEMLKKSKRELSQLIEPLVSKARSFKEGQDLKQAYEAYGDVLKYQPSNEEALNERNRIFNDLYKRSKKVFREALIKEDLSDYSNAKEKFEEVKQISPINSEYYNKASEKLKNYLE